ncbi:hypothetical protein ACHAXN_005534, partial [Cyclotella atomus]
PLGSPLDKPPTRQHQAPVSGTALERQEATMEVLPTPHSIAIGTLIALYSDPYSPLYPNDTAFENDAIGWPSRLSTLIQQLVREEDGYLFSQNDKHNLHIDLDENDVLADLVNLMDDPASAGADHDKPLLSNRKTSQALDTSVKLHTEPLSTLLSRIDRAFHPTFTSKAHTPPSQALLTTLQHATTSIEHLSQLIDQFHSLLEGRGVPHNNNRNKPTPIGLDGDSSFGVYLRKICLGMEELPFEAMSRLWIAFGGFVKDATTCNTTTKATAEEWLPSSSQVESIVKKSCLSINSHDNFFWNDTAKRANWTTDTSGTDLLQTHPETTSLHFLLFYTSLLQHERCATLESLHRYFDYGMIHERKERAERNLAGIITTGSTSATIGHTMPSGPNGGITTSVNNEQQRTAQMIRPTNPNAATQNNNKVYKESNIMQYAAILLAMTYHRFGYKSLALQATQEAIRVAQQSNDEECVLFAQGWLAYIQEDDVSMLRRCRDRAVERGLGSLAAGAALELGRREGYGRVKRQDDLEDEGDGLGVCLAWESIMTAGRSAPVGGRGLMMGGTSASRGGGVQYVTDVDNMTSSEALSILGRQNMAIAGLWDSTGHSSSASLSSIASLNGYNLSPGDAAYAMQRILSSFCSVPCLDPLSMETALKSTTQPRRCIYSTSLNVLKALHGKGSAFDWVQSTTSVLHEWSVRSHDLNIAQMLECILANHAAFPSSPSNAIEASLVSLSRSAHAHLQAGDFSTAKVATRQAMLLAANNSFLIHQGWQLLQLSLIDLEAAISAPSVNPAVERALPSLLECLHLAEKHSMDPLRAVALITLARVLLNMGRFQRARALLSSAMPLVMQHGHMWFQAEACLTLSKCHLAEARKMESDTPSVTKSTRIKSISSPATLQRTALSQLEKAITLFIKIDDVQRLRQAYYLQAVVYNSIPRMEAKRDEAAQKFSELSARKQTESKTWTVVHELLAGDRSHPNL